MDEPISAELSINLQLLQRIAPSLIPIAPPCFARLLMKVTLFGSVAYSSENSFQFLT